MKKNQTHHQDRKGETSIRFTDYNYIRQTEEDEIEIEVTTEIGMMNIEMIEGGYAVDEIIEKAKKLYNEQKCTTFRCKDCKTKNMSLEEVLKHLKECIERTDNLGYRSTQNIINKTYRES